MQQPQSSSYVSLTPVQILTQQAPTFQPIYQPTHEQQKEYAANMNRLSKTTDPAEFQELHEKLWIQHGHMPRTRINLANILQRFQFKTKPPPGFSNASRGKLTFNPPPNVFGHVAGAPFFNPPENHDGHVKGVAVGYIGPPPDHPGHVPGAPFYNPHKGVPGHDDRFAPNQIIPPTEFNPPPGIDGHDPLRGFYNPPSGEKHNPLVHVGYFSRPPGQTGHYPGSAWYNPPKGEEGHVENIAPGMHGPHPDNANIHMQYIRNLALHHQSADYYSRRNNHIAQQQQQQQKLPQHQNHAFGTTPEGPATPQKQHSTQPNPFGTPSQSFTFGAPVPVRANPPVPVHATNNKREKIKKEIKVHEEHVKAAHNAHNAFIKKGQYNAAAHKALLQAHEALLKAHEEHVKVARNAEAHEAHEALLQAHEAHVKAAHNMSEKHKANTQHAAYEANARARHNAAQKAFKAQKQHSEAAQRPQKRQTPHRTT
jgi:hypothetical protein